MARPSKYSEETAEKITGLLRAGNTRKTSAEASGIDYGTFRRWEASYASFASLVTRAEAEAEASYATVLATAARPHDVVETRVVTKSVDGVSVTETTTTTRREFDWRAAESWLKRRRPDDWSDRVKQEVSGTLGIVEQAADTLNAKLLHQMAASGPGEVAQES